MKSKILFLTLAMFFCLAAQIYTLTNMASGAGCGTNPLGDTSGDTDFYVSRNQNLPVSDMSSSAASSTGKVALPLGSTANLVSQKATIQSLNPDKSGPQITGAAIVWRVDAINPNNEKMLYDFLLRGPATGDKLLEKTGWIAENSWTWNTTNADAGENQIVVQVKRASAADSEDSKTQSYVVSAGTQNEGDVAAVDMTPIASAKAASNSSATDVATTADTNAATSGVNPHPVSKTGDFDDNKPRVAPDERPKATATSASGLADGPNMSMPDPSPKSSDQNTTTATTAVQAVQREVAPVESRTMDVDGKWTVKLVDSGSSVDLILVQAGESVVGYGNLNEKSTKLPLNVKGTVSGNSMNLDAQTVVGEYVNKIDKSINLDLVKVDRVISGSYEMYSGKDLAGKGNATASRFAT